MKHANMSDASEAITREGGEILFSTPFDYLFPEAARDPASVLPAEPRVVDALLELGAAIADPGPGDPAGAPEAFDSNIPAGFTYLGQFIDHDITARTDRELADIGSQIVERPIQALDPDVVVRRLRNGRRPELDLDAVYGDGPGLIPQVQTVASPLLEANLTMRLETGPTFDLPRYDGEAVIADIRNDENVMISQLHATIIALHNRIAATLTGSDAQRYIRARQLTRWAYQAVVLHDYLPSVCDPAIVFDVLANGPRWFNPHFRGGGLFMPLEFSVAAFRFGHSMIRPRYRLNGTRTDETIMSLLEPARILLINGRYLDPAFVVEWSNFFGSGAQPARRIDARLSEGLFTLGFEANPARAVLNQLAQRNLLRSVVLSIPTGQAVAEAMGIEPLTRRELLDGQPPGVARAFSRGRLSCRTPLWYYVLQEAKIHTHGQSLGAVGSRIVAEVLIGLLKADPNSILNCCAVAGAQAPKGIDTGCGVVTTFEELVTAAGRS